MSASTDRSNRVELLLNHEPEAPIEAIEGAAQAIKNARMLNAASNAVIESIILGNLLALPPASAGYRGTLAEQLHMLKADGYESVQSWDDWRSIQDAGLRASGIARLQQPEQAAAIAEVHADAGLEFTNLHVGIGFESDAEMDALADSILQASAHTGHRLLVETHRATATQDIWRTLRWIERFPELRFTADLSHWYTGHELTYGGEFEQRMARLQTVFERTRAIHGRIGNSCCAVVGVTVSVKSLGVFVCRCDDFYQLELKDRKEFYYPPFVKLVKITTRHAVYGTAEKAAHALHRDMANLPLKKIVLGPEKGSISRIKNLYQLESLIKLDRQGDTQSVFKERLGKILEDLQAIPEFRSVRWIVDVDPN